jgi:hypothetical protein
MESTTTMYHSWHTKKLPFACRAIFFACGAAWQTRHVRHEPTLSLLTRSFVLKFARFEPKPFKRSASLFRREALVLTSPSWTVGVTLTVQSLANKLKIESPSDMHKCEVSTTQWQRIQITCYRQVRCTERACSAVLWRHQLTRSESMNVYWNSFVEGKFFFRHPINVMFSRFRG